MRLDCFFPGISSVDRGVFLLEVAVSLPRSLFSYLPHSRLYQLMGWVLVVFFSLARKTTRYSEDTETKKVKELCFRSGCSRVYCMGGSHFYSR